MTDTCDANDPCPDCGQIVHVGEWPFCPHGRAYSAIVPDDVPGGFWAENGFDQPRKFYSRSEHARALAAEGLEIRAKWAGENDQHLTRWDTVDLNAAAALVNRGVEARREKHRRWQDATIPITVTDGASFTGKDLK
jgi:hypothetical protein